MDKKIRIRITPGCSMRDPVTRRKLDPRVVHEVPRNVFWLRALKDGDVQLAGAVTFQPPKGGEK